MTKLKCPYCGKMIGTWKSLLGGRATDWHKPRKGSKAPTLGRALSAWAAATSRMSGERRERSIQYPRWRRTNRRSC
jgi:hypothetical protein